MLTKLKGYTSNRARQNVASFLAKGLGIDWRIGAEWYESLLTDYDISSNWGTRISVVLFPCGPGMSYETCSGFHSPVLYLK